MHAVICLLAPVLIESAPKVRNAFGTAQKSIAAAQVCGMDVLETGFALGNPGILFPRIEKEVKEENKENKENKENAAPASAAQAKKQTGAEITPAGANTAQNGLVEIGDLAELSCVWPG
jgi:hypothetical protein